MKNKVGIAWVILFLLAIILTSISVFADFGKVGYEGLFSDNNGNLLNGSSINVSLKYRGGSCTGSILVEDNTTRTFLNGLSTTPLNLSASLSYQEVYFTISINNTGELCYNSFSTLHSMYANNSFYFAGQSSSYFLNTSSSLDATNLINRNQLNNYILSDILNITHRPTDLSNFSNTLGYFNNITNFTGTLTNAQYCTYDSTSQKINCTSSAGSGTTITIQTIDSYMVVQNGTTTNISLNETKINNTIDDRIIGKLDSTDQRYNETARVDSINLSKLDKTGGTITGNLVINGNFTTLGSLTTINATTIDVNGSIIPNFDNLFSVGSAPFKYANGYFVNLYGNIDYSNITSAPWLKSSENTTLNAAYLISNRADNTANVSNTTANSKAGTGTATCSAGTYPQNVSSTTSGLTSDCIAISTTGGADYSINISSTNLTVTALLTSNTSATNRLTALETSNSTKTNQINALLTDNSTKTTQITNLQTDNTTQSNQITALNTDNTTKTSQINALITDNTTKTNQIIAINTSNTSTTNRLTALETSNLTMVPKGSSNLVTLNASNITGGTFTGLYTFSSLLTTSITGNSGTVTNGLYTTTTYNTPTIGGIGTSLYVNNYSILLNASNITAGNINLSTFNITGVQCIQLYNSSGQLGGKICGI